MGAGQYRDGAVEAVVGAVAGIGGGHVGPGDVGGELGREGAVDPHVDVDGSGRIGVDGPAADEDLT